MDANLDSNVLLDSDSLGRMLTAAVVFALALGAGFAADAGFETLLEITVESYAPYNVLGESVDTLSSLVIGLVGAAYLLWTTDESRLARVFNVTVPSFEDLKLIGLGVVLNYMMLFWIIAGFSLLGVQFASGIETENTSGALLLGAVASLLVVAPAEEIVSRRILQDSLVAELGNSVGIVLASALFAVPHLVARYTGPGAVTAVVGVFASGCVYGYVYERSDNLTVPIAVHGLFNGINYGLNFVGV
jgi:hypothetical protein